MNAHGRPHAIAAGGNHLAPVAAVRVPSAFASGAAETIPRAAYFGIKGVTDRPREEVLVIVRLHHSRHSGSGRRSLRCPLPCCICEIVPPPTVTCVAGTTPAGRSRRLNRNVGQQPGVRSLQWPAPEPGQLELYKPQLTLNFAAARGGNGPCLGAGIQLAGVSKASKP